jgi:HD-GYP domain-containing protein (c-di-GMP phosphodiesterase class II)
MSPNRRINAYVTAVALAAIALTAYAWYERPPFPGIWPTLVLLLVAFLLQVSARTARGGDAEGSISFIVHQAAGILFGPLWGGLTAAISTAFSQVVARRERIKILFNVSQRTLSLVVAVFSYVALGGSIPPKYLMPGSAWEPSDVLRNVVAFFASAFVYFIVNSVLVSGAVAISRGKSIRQVWRTSSLWVLGYDIGASSLALLVSWVYLRFDSDDGLAKLGFLAVFIPIIAARHIYAKLNTLKSLYDELDVAYEKLELNVREQLEMMVKSIEARDPYTSGHSRRVAALSKAIALDLGLEAKLVDEIENAALLHDVGKIHAEFAPLLSKEGRLTEEEWDIMKTHSTKSAELVALFSRFQGNVWDSVRWHHERRDGKGYPDGVEGEKIPMGARIIMIADTIDAMSTDRPYRKALSFEKVVAELIKYRAIQFDPALVDSTVTSVTVRRLVSDKEFLAEQTNSIKPGVKKQGRPALRSQKSFWEGLRASSVGES